MGIGVSVDYRKYGVFVITIFDEDLEQGVRYSLYTAVNPVYTPIVGDTVTPEMLEDFSLVTADVQYSGTEDGFVDYYGAVSLSDVGDTYTYVVLLVRNNTKAVIGTTSSSIVVSGAGAWPTVTVGDFEVALGQGIGFSGVPINDLCNVVFNVYSVVGTVPTLAAGDVFDESVFTDALVTLKKSIIGGPDRTSSMSGYIPVDDFNASQEVTFVTTITIADLNNTLLSSEVIVGPSSVVTLPSVFPIDSDILGAEFLVIDQTSRIVVSQNMGSAERLPTIVFKAPSAFDNGIYLSNIFIQSQVDLESGDGLVALETALTNCGVDEYVVVAKAKIDESNLKADYADYHASFNGTLHMGFEQMPLPSIMGLEVSGAQILDYFGFQALQPSDLIHNVDAGVDVLSTVTLAYSLDGVEYVDDLSELLALVTAIGAYEIFIKASKAEYSDFIDSVSITIQKRVLSFTSTTYAVPSIVEGESGSALVVEVTGVTSSDFATIDSSYPVGIITTATYANSVVSASVDVTIKFAFDGASTVNSAYYTLPSQFVAEGKGKVIARVGLTCSNSDVSVASIVHGVSTLTAAGTIAEGGVSGIAAGHDVAVVATGTYPHSNYGNSTSGSVQVAIVFTLTGADVKYYNPPASTNITGTITKAPLTVSGVSVPAINAGATTLAVAATIGSVNGNIGSYDIGVTGVGTYPNSTNTGTTPISKTVPVVFTLTGTDAGSYTAPSTMNVTGSVRGRPIGWLSGYIPYVYAVPSTHPYDMYVDQYVNAITDLPITGDPDNKDFETIVNTHLPGKSSRGSIDFSGGMVPFQFGYNATDWSTALTNTNTSTTYFPDHEGYRFYLTNQNGTFEICDANGNAVAGFVMALNNVIVDGCAYTGYMNTTSNEVGTLNLYVKRLS